MKEKKSKIMSVFAGVATGFVNGLFGGGGGMIAVPLLKSALKKPTKEAHATAILIILPLSVASGILYASFGAFDLSIGLPTTFGVFVGGIIGAFALSSLSSDTITFIFNIAMALAGVKMLFF